MTRITFCSGDGPVLNAGDVVTLPANRLQFSSVLKFASPDRVADRPSPADGSRITPSIEPELSPRRWRRILKFHARRLSPRETRDGRRWPKFLKFQGPDRSVC